jgi:hypothetical protein
VSIQTRDVPMLVVSLLAAACSLCLYVPAVLYRAWAAVWSFGVTLLVFGVIAVVMLARVLREGGSDVNIRQQPRGTLPSNFPDVGRLRRSLISFGPVLTV